MWREPPVYITTWQKYIKWESWMSKDKHTGYPSLTVTHSHNKPVLPKLTQSVLSNGDKSILMLVTWIPNKSITINIGLRFSMWSAGENCIESNGSIPRDNFSRGILMNHPFYWTLICFWGKSSLSNVWSSGLSLRNTDVWLPHPEDWVLNGVLKTSCHEIPTKALLYLFRFLQDLSLFILPLHFVSITPKPDWLANHNYLWKTCFIKAKTAIYTLQHLTFISKFF